MPKKTLSLAESLSVRSANLRRKAQSHRVLHWIGGRALATIAIGAALSVGGVTEALQSVHLLSRRDLDVSTILGDQSPRPRVVAKTGDGIVTNSLFTQSANQPKSGILQKVGLFGDSWLLPEVPMQASAPVPPSDVFHAEMLRINDAIRRQFFANAVPFGEIIHAKAQKYDVDPALVAAVVETESCFRSHARSQVGARGLMQLMPRTGRWMGARNLYNAEQNVDAGAKYLRYLNHRFDGNLTKTIAAYNAGEGNVRRYNGVPPFRETRNYVDRVMTQYEKRRRELKLFDAQHGSGVVADEGAMTLR